MRPILLTAAFLAGCATTAADIASKPPFATYSSARPMPAVMACVQRSLDTMEWGLCARAQPHVVPQKDGSELIVEGPRGVDAMLEGQQRGDKAVYELRVGRQVDWGLCSLSGTYKALTQACM